MRWAIAIVVGAVGALCMFACTTVSLDIGRDDQPSTEIDAANDPGVDAPTRAAPTLIERLETRCAAKAGLADYYENAAALTSRVAGRWYYCPARGTFSLPLAGIELRLDGAPKWAFLSFDANAQQFVPASEETRSGPLSYVVPAGVSAADGGPDGGPDGSAEGGADAGMPVERELAPSDTTRLNGIQLWLELPDGAYKFIADFEKEPRLMQLRELGGDPVRGVFVPID